MFGFAIPLWLKIVGPIALFALVVGGVMAWGNSRYNDGVEATDQKWVDASNRLKAEAAKSATRADDRAAVRLEEFVAQANEDAAAVEKAKAEGRSPFDELFR